MHALNYLRKATADLKSRFIPGLRSLGFHHDADACESVIDCANQAVKFVLPDGGRILNDELKGLPEILRLPYPNVIIEYASNENGGGGLVERELGKVNTTPAPKRIAVAKEVDGGIEIYSIVMAKINSVDCWSMIPFACRIGKIDNQKTKDLPLKNITNKKNSDIGVVVSDIGVVFKPTGNAGISQFGSEWERYAYCDLYDEMMAVLELIEALSCKNIDYEPMEVRKINRGAKNRGAIPFDEYRALVLRESRNEKTNNIERGNRSPRQHLRRGHIRRLQSGDKVWVNSTIVNAGADGKIISFYDTRKIASNVKHVK